MSATPGEDRGEVRIPEELRRALEGHPGARAAFEALAPSHQRAYVDWIAEAKKADTRQRRAEKALKLLGAGRLPY